MVEMQMGEDQMVNIRTGQPLGCQSLLNGNELRYRIDLIDMASIRP